MTDNRHAAASGTSPGPRPGLRERQKTQTRADIRAAALELFAKQGYESTTVAQIAARANVSHTTFFRYFQSKEHVVIDDDLDADRKRVLENLPPGLDQFGLVRQMLSEMWTITQSDPWASNPERFAILRTEPALRATFQTESDRAIAEGLDFIAAYLGSSPDDPKLRIFVAALSGVMFHLAESATEHMLPLAAYLAAIDLMEEGFPL